MSDFLKKDVADIKKPSLHFDLAETQEHSPRIDSYLGGKPYLTKENEIHTCPECMNKMDFVMQIAMPEKYIKMKKIYSFYYCFQCAEQDKVGGYAVNMYINPTEEAMIKDFEYEPKFKNHKLQFYPAYEIPEWEYLKEAYPDFYQKMKNFYGERASEAYVQVEQKVREYFTDTGFKFRGHPETISFDDIPNCSQTGEKMEPFISLESVSEMGLNWLGVESYLILFKSKNHDEFAIRVIDFAEELYDDLYDDND